MEHTLPLKSNGDFRRMYAKAGSTAGSCVVLFLRRNRKGFSRLGLTVSSKLGNAVHRNRMRRRMKEAYRLIEVTLPSGYDIVLVARSGAYHAPFKELQLEIARLFGRQLKQPVKKS